MDLPIKPPIAPMLSKLVNALPEGDGWLFEPKWDGFRALIFRDGSEWFLQSRDEKPLNRYFPELEHPILTQLPERIVLDGEIVIATDGALDFEALLIRIHPAKSRVAMLAKQSPAGIVFWDMLCLGDEDLTGLGFATRRARLEATLPALQPPLHLTPMTRDRALAVDWFTRFEGAGLDGVMAKPAQGRYEPGQRSMFKVKHQRTADCVVGGFRWHKNGRDTHIGSLLLGLYDDAGRLQHVGVAASFSESQRRALVAELSPLRDNAQVNHPWHFMLEGQQVAQRAPGMTSRWNRDKDLGWEPLRAERVVEVSFDHMQGRRFRHTAHFVRWRPDKRAQDCTYEQLEVTPPMELAQIFGASR